jgi:outer membrane lipoprotein SlyB
MSSLESIQDEKAQVKFDDIFSTRNPRDAKAGLSSGLKSIGKGVLGGVATLIALPIQGAREEGVVGAIKGLGLGLLSAVTM